MRAITINDYSAPISISNVERPELDDDSLLIAVSAASINPIDNILRSGDMKEDIPLTFPHVMGFDVSGVVATVGKNVRGFEVGDHVFSRPSQEDAGAIADFARVKGSEVALKPKNMSHTEAAAVPLACLTAWQALITEGKLGKGDKVLIQAGSGGVGTFAIQIAKHVGAHVATTVGARNIDLAKRLGADVVIDYKTQKFDEMLSDYDLVFDMVGGETMARSFNVLKKGGTLISIKGQDEDELADKHGVRFKFLWMSPDGGMLAEIGALIEQGVITPVVDTVFSMDEAAAAYEKLAEGHAVGKIVVQVNA